ncbi:MAG: efflux RND transporter permease subunit [Pseudomonadales bacterium]|jgi:multidrug efflux pump subunit AcrB|nr:efflux RND transporter permease subunit [Pseudomonadales bacterium]HJN50832.1 efflux RND transporter permease subunit [Pseudomonadales bacterium]
MADQVPQVRGIIGWCAQNHVATNLLMFFIIGMGLYGLLTIKKETMPEFSVNQISVSVLYRGGAPEEVERSVVVKIEKAVENIEGIKEITSFASEGSGQVSIEVEEGYDLAEMMDEVKLAVDSISTFPGETERPVIRKRTWRNGAINIQVAGPLDERTLKELTERIREEMLLLPEVTSVQEMGMRPFEIAIEISEQTLREYGISLDQVAQAIRRWSIDLPGGAIRTDAGDIRLRTTGQAYTGLEYGEIVLLTQPDGTRVRLRDVATIKDGFAEVESYSFFNGNRSFGINAMATENENPIEVAAAVKKYVAERQATLPEGVELSAWADMSSMLDERMDMMLKNMAMGGLLVMIILSLFLHFKVAFWVMIGLPVAFLGAFSLMQTPGIDITVNIMSLFGFILVLGVVVDDAIIIGESAYAETEKSGYSVESIVIGAQRVAVPATFGVLTSICAFLPLVFQVGRTSAFSGAIGWVVILCLIFSLIESKLILPSHLATMRSSHGKKRGVADWVDQGLKSFVDRVYTPFLTMTMQYRSLTISVFVTLIILTFGLVAGGIVRSVWFPEFEGDFLMAEVELREGAPESLITSIVKQMDSSLREIDAELQAEYNFDENVVKNIFAVVNGGNSAMIQVDLLKSEDRGETKVPMKEIENRWRDKVGTIAGVQKLEFRSMNSMGGGKPVSFRVQGSDFDTVEAAAEALAEHLATYEGLFEVQSSSQAGPEELKLSIRPEAEALGISLMDLASQVRQAFYGTEAQRIQRGDSEVRVMVRYPRNERRSIGNLENMWIKTPDGRELPFHSVAEYRLERGYNVIRRQDGQRTVTVDASADLETIEPMQIVGQVFRNFNPTIKSSYPGVTLTVGGSSRAVQTSQAEMFSGFGVALFGIYILMAVPLKSYLQPLLIMIAIPFGIIGAVIGHLIFDRALNAISFIGIIALSGVVVNDSLILVHEINRRIREGASVVDAAIASGGVRFRAILLTSLTTFFGLLPIMFETSMQAQIVIPMAIALAFGILFSTIITLVLVPCLYSSLDSVKRAVIQLWTGPPDPVLSSETQA